ncbi:DNA helicase [Rossellomorea vietnamensis]|uniref:DNA helicase n=1 Tax=Rossellomorea vietnamensis TaxID=218284 RepID=A0A5D4KGS6_9BACI|nr:DNA helicase [Rossellomorea vietnamensis]
MSLLGCACIKSGSALVSPDRQMFSREKKAIFPFILLRLFDPEGLGAGTRLRGLTCPASPAGDRTPSASILLVKRDEGKIVFKSAIY